MDAPWFYRVNGREFGPIAAAALRAQHEAGTLGGDVEVRRDGDARWQSLSDALGSSARAAATAATTNAAQSGDDELHWFYRLAGQELGPLTFRELTELAQQGGLTADDEIKCGVDGRYRRAGSIGRLMAAMPYLEPERIQRVLSTLGTDPSVAVAEPTLASAPAPQSPPYQAAAMQPLWFAGIRGVEYGPLSLVQLSQMLAAGQITVYDFVRYGPYGGWLPASPTIEQSLASLVEVAPALQPVAIVDKPEPVATPRPTVPAPVPTAPAQESRPQLASSVAVLATPRPDPTPPDPTPAVLPPAATTPLHETAKAESVPQTAARPAPLVVVKAPEPRPAAATPATTPRAVATPAPPPAMSPAKRSSASSSSGGGWLDQVSLKSPASMVLIALVVIGAGYGMLQFLPTSGGDRAKLETLQQILAEFRRHREEKSAEGEWTAFLAKTNQTLAPIVKELDATASRRPIKQELLWAARDRGPEMLSDARQQPSSSEEKFESHLKRAAFGLGLGPDPDAGG